MICVASAAFWTRCGAAENFYSYHEDGILYRVDNNTGEIHKLVKPLTGTPMWVKCEVREPVRTQQRQPQPLPSAPQIAPFYPAPVAQQVPCVRPQPATIIDVGTMPTLSSDPVAPKHLVSTRRQIEVFDQNDKDITNVIDDAERAKCRPEINAYDALHVSHTLKTSGDRIKGIVSIENKGNRKIEILELTLSVRVMGKEKAVEHHFILGDNKPGSKNPPLPSFGGSSLSIMQAVDVPMPGGVLNGMPDVKVTFIRFEQDQQ